MDNHNGDLSLHSEQARALVERGDDVELLGRCYATVRRTVATSRGRPCSENQEFRSIRLRTCPTGKLTGKSGLNPSQNSFLIAASQKVRVRLSFERAHGNQTVKDPSDTGAGEAATSAGRAEGGASAIIRYRRDHVETDADRLCPRVDRRAGDLVLHRMLADGASFLADKAAVPVAR